MYLFPIQSGLPTLRAVIISSTNLIIKWTEPEHANGPITSYSLYYRLMAARSWSVGYEGVGFSADLTELQAAAGYEFVLQVYHIT